MKKKTVEIALKAVVLKILTAMYNSYMLVYRDLNNDGAAKEGAKLHVPNTTSPIVVICLCFK
jgi:hypothetical protein